MKIVCVHPGVLTHGDAFMRLEPLGVELVAASVRRAGHDVRLIDLQVAARRDFVRLLHELRPDAVLVGMSYLANVPEVIELCVVTKERLPRALTCVGGHSASFTARELLEHAAGAIDCVVRGEGEEAAPRVLAAWKEDQKSLHRVDGVVTLDGEGPPPKSTPSLDDLRPARDLLMNRNKYFVGVLDPAASIVCSAWTSYGRNHRKIAPEICAEDLASIREQGVFIVDDVAFIQGEDGHAVADAVERRGIKKRYCLETRGDVLLNNKELLRRWKKLGLEYLFLGLEAIDAEGLVTTRKGVSSGKSFEALEYARSLGITVAVNISADPDWDLSRFQEIRAFSLSVPAIVNLTVNTPYPGTETFLTEARKLTTRDYRLFDVQHAVLPTKLGLARFYEELAKTQLALHRKHVGVTALKATAALSAKLLLRGQTSFSFVRALLKLNSVYEAKRQLADHENAVDYELKLPGTIAAAGTKSPRRLHVLPPETARATTKAPTS